MLSPHSPPPWAGGRTENVTRAGVPPKTFIELRQECLSPKNAPSLLLEIRCHKIGVIG